MSCIPMKRRVGKRERERERENKMSDLEQRFWVFGYHAYYPTGGLDDVDTTFDDLEEARSHGKKLLEKTYDAVEIFDSTTKNMLNVFTEEEVKEGEKLVECPWILTKGKNKGMRCKKKGPKRWGGLCPVHYAKK